MPIAAIIGKENNHVSGKIVDMLEAMSYNKNTFSVATASSIMQTKDIADINIVDSRMAIGNTSFSSGGEKVSVLPLKGQNDSLSLTIEGYVFEPLKHSNNSKDTVALIVDLISEMMKGSENISVTLSSILSILRGAFSLAIMSKKGITVARDVVGFEPVYWGENQQFIAFASERKALWRIGLRNTSFLPPSCIFSTDGKITDVIEVAGLHRQCISDISLDVAARRLSEKLKMVFSRNFGSLKEAHILFSGGIDSSLVAKILGDMGVKVDLYAASIEEAHDVEVACKSASELGYNLHLRTLNLQEIEDYLFKTIYAVEEANVMSVCIGIPIYAAMESVNSEGARFIFAGQGADELFGGYSRYLRVAGNGCEKLNEEMWRDVVQMSEANLRRDSAIAMANNVDCYLPFLDLDIIDLSMGFPVKLKVRGAEDILRKHVLREAAKILGLPESISSRPKKAVQYSSGSDRAIRKLSRREGKRPTEYVEYVFRKIFQEYYSANED